MKHKTPLEEFSDCITTTASRTSAAMIMEFVSDLPVCIHDKINMVALFLNTIVRISPTPEIKEQVITIFQEALDLAKNNMALHDFWDLPKQ